MTDPIPVTSPIKFLDDEAKRTMTGTGTSSFVVLDSETKKLPATTWAHADALMPTPNPGMEWVAKLKDYEVIRLQGLVAGAVGAAPADVNLTDFIRYLTEALKRQAANGYSISPYQLAEDTAKIILGQTAFTFPGVNTPEYSHRISVDETKFVDLCQQMKKMEQQLLDLRDELNHKDQLWGAF